MFRVNIWTNSSITNGEKAKIIDIVFKPGESPETKQPIFILC